jgi:hypothetical protein
VHFLRTVAVIPPIIRELSYVHACGLRELSYVCRSLGRAEESLGIREPSYDLGLAEEELTSDSLLGIREPSYDTIWV